MAVSCVRLSIRYIIEYHGLSHRLSLHIIAYHTLNIIAYHTLKITAYHRKLGYT